MKPKLTDEQLLARDEAKVAARRAKIEKRKARAASKDVRRMEADLRVLERLMQEGTPTVDTLKETYDAIQSDLRVARAEAIK